MTRDEFVSLVGETIAHYTYAQNMPSIQASGLMSAAALAMRAGVGPDEVALRPYHARFAVAAKQVKLNHQKPLLAGQGQKFLDGYDLRGWARQLDERIFFLPRASDEAGPAFATSLGADMVSLRLSSCVFFDAFAPDIWLSPINSGSATRKPSWRGDWLYVSVAETPDDFRLNRVRRGLTKSRDRVAEISIRQAISPDLMTRLIMP